MENVPWVQHLLPYLLNRDKSIRSTHQFIRTFAALIMIYSLTTNERLVPVGQLSCARGSRVAHMHATSLDMMGKELPLPLVDHCIKERNFGFKGTYPGRLQTPIEGVARFHLDPKA